MLSCQLESLFREMLDIAQYGEYTCIFYIQTKQAEQILQNFHVKPFRNQGFSYSHVLLHFRLSTLLSDNHPAGPSQDYILPRNHWKLEDFVPSSTMDGLRIQGPRHGLAVLQIWDLSLNKEGGYSKWIQNGYVYIHIYLHTKSGIVCLLVSWLDHTSTIQQWIWSFPIISLANHFF